MTIILKTDNNSMNFSTKGKIQKHNFKGFWMPTPLSFMFLEQSIFQSENIFDLNTSSNNIVINNPSNMSIILKTSLNNITIKE